MKKYMPYFLVVIVILIFGILIWHWYQSNQPTPRISPEGISVEDLTDEEQNSLIKGVKDYKEAELKPTDVAKFGAFVGSVRYLLENGRLKFSVITQLPQDESKSYTVWVHPLDSDQLQQVTQLEAKKGGMLGSASIPSNLLPAEIIVSTAQEASEVANNVVLKTIIPAPEEK